MKLEYLLTDVMQNIDLVAEGDIYISLGSVDILIYAPLVRQTNINRSKALTSVTFGDKI